MVQVHLKDGVQDRVEQNWVVQVHLKGGVQDRVEQNWNNHHRQHYRRVNLSASKQNASREVTAHAQEASKEGAAATQEEWVLS